MALRYWVTSGDNNYNSITNWSSTSGGATGSSVPTTADDAIWDINSGSGDVIINVSSVAKSINFASFSGTLDFRNTLAVSGSMSLGPNLNFANTSGTPILRASATGTLRSYGKEFPYDFSILTPTSANISLFDNWYARNVTYDVSASGCNFNANNFYITGTLSNLNTTRSIGGTTAWILSGTGSLTTSNTSGNIVNNLVIDTTGTITFGNNIGGTTMNWSYVSGNVVTTGTTFKADAGTIGLNGITFSDISIPSTTTLTLTSDLVYTGNLTTGSFSNTSKTINGFKIRHVGSTGSFLNTIGGASTGLAGTTVLSFEGSGNIDCGPISGLGKSIIKPITINTTGTYSLGSNFKFHSSTFTYTSGNLVDNTTTYTFDISPSTGTTTTFNGVSPLQIKAMRISAPGTAFTSIVLNDTLNCNLIYRSSDISNSWVTFKGTNGFVCNEFVSGQSLVGGFEFVGGVTYQINSRISVGGGGNGVFPRACWLRPGDGTGANVNILVNLIISPGVVQEISNIRIRYIDARDGETMWVFNPATEANNIGELSTCQNVRFFTQPQAVGG